MFNHAGSTHRARVRHNSLVKNKLDSAAWQVMRGRALPAKGHGFCQATRATCTTATTDNNNHSRRASAHCRAGSLLRGSLFFFLARAWCVSALHRQADAVIECIGEALPWGSLELLRRAIDAVRFLSNFYLALYLTCFASLWWGGPAALSMHLSPLASWLARLSAVPVVLANMFTEPFLSVQFAVISTMSCLNPLLLGENLEFVQETTKMMDYGAR
jgi:hypothetical protein